jgi:salicylate hydroxylase
MWLGTGRSFLCYPVSSGRLMNMVAFVPTNLESDESWTVPAIVRLSIGLGTADDLIRDLDQALGE